MQADRCVFCEIVAGRERASIVAEDPFTVTIVDLRQFHPGHVLVIPREHLADIRSADDAILGRLAPALRDAASAVARAFPSDGLSIWHSVGAGAGQEVAHLHFHVHPRLAGDGMLHVYPSAPPLPSRARLDRIAEQLRSATGGPSSPHHPDSRSHGAR